jgi:hypothetical protein
MGFPTAPYCCSDVRDFFNAHCASINETLLLAFACQNPPACAPQYFQPPQTTTVPATATAAATQAPPPTSTPGTAPATSTAAPVTQTATGTTPAAAAGTIPADVTTVFKVTVSLSLPVSLTAFNTSVRQSLREALAITAGLTRGEAGRVQVLRPLETSRRFSHRLASSVTDRLIHLPPNTLSRPCAARGPRGAAAPAGGRGGGGRHSQHARLRRCRQGRGGADGGGHQR